MTASLPFLKMHGLGNDFVVLDGRARPLAITPEAARRIADRTRGVGCDQLLILEPARAGGDLFLKILNADGGEVGACGNGTRCVARLIFEETGQAEAKIETRAALLTGVSADGPDGTALVTVDMGPAYTRWDQIPLARAMDTLHLDFACGPLHDPCAVGLGNPHVLFFVEDAEAVELATLGPQIEHDPLFPERVNVGIVQSLGDHWGDDRLRYRVWERGVGITVACGSGACAAAVAAARRGVTGRRVRVTLDGGDLLIDWRESDDHVLMTGPASKSFSGTLAPELLG